MTDPSDIEREIERERAGLSDALHALDARLSPEHLVDRAAEMIQSHGGEAADMAWKTARDNPLAVGLVGAGLAWLVASNARSDTPSVASYDARIKPTAPGLAQPEPPMAGFDARVAAADAAMADAAMTAETTGADFEGETDMTTSTYDETTMDRVKGQAQGARDRVTQSAGTLRDRIGEGLDNLPEGARSRILSARLAAIDAQAAVEARMRRTADTARRSAKDNPLMVGALALAVGAAIGAALPRTSTENRMIGAKRDQLFDDADRIFREETAKLRSVAETAVAEGKSAIKDTLKDGPPTEDDPAARVTEAARTEARRQKLGSVG